MRVHAKSSLVLMLVALPAALLAACGDRGPSTVQVTNSAVAIYNATAQALREHDLTAQVIAVESAQTQAVAATQRALDDDATRQAGYLTQTAAVLRTAQVTLRAELTHSAALTATVDTINAGLTQAAALPHVAGRLLDPDYMPLVGTAVRLYRDDGDDQFAPFSRDAFVGMIRTDPGGAFDFGPAAPGGYWLEADYYTLSPALRAELSPNEPVALLILIPAGSIQFVAGVDPTPTPTRTPGITPTRTPTRTRTPAPTRTSGPSPTGTLPTATRTPSDVPTRESGFDIVTLTNTSEPGDVDAPDAATLTPTARPAIP